MFRRPFQRFGRVVAALSTLVVMMTGGCAVSKLHINDECIMAMTTLNNRVSTLNVPVNDVRNGLLIQLGRYNPPNVEFKEVKIDGEGTNLPSGQTVQSVTLSPADFDWSGCLGRHWPT